MEELTQQRIEKARRNARLCGWMTLLSVLLVIANSILFVFDRLNWQLLVSSMTTLLVFGLLTVNNRRIARGKRPWGE